MTGALPLEGLRVLDLSRLLPGPYATLVLADLGARVDKVEEPSAGDPTRQAPPLAADGSAVFAGLNRNKRSIAVDLKSAQGVETIKALARRYDVLVESSRPGVMDRLGLGFEVLSRVNPRLVYCSISGFGATGPDRLRAGHDLGYLARAGVLGYGGDPSGPPAMPGVQVADIGGSLWALVGILAALHERARTGRGRFVDVSMTDGAVAFLHVHLAARLVMGASGAPLRRGKEALNGGLPCYGLYPTLDGRWLAVAALEPKFFFGLCEALGRPELAEGAYDAGARGRATRAQLEDIFRARTQAQWIEFFRPRDVCVEPVLEGDEVLADPHLIARGLLEERDGVVWLRTPGSLGWAPLTPPPGLGQHTDAILQECGLKEDPVSKAFTSEETEDDAVVGRPIARAARGHERPITKEGYRALLEEARRVRVELAGKVQVDPSGSLLEHRLRELEATLESVRVVEPVSVDGSIRFGSRVAVRWDDGRTQVVRLVGPDEADAKRGEVSIESPLAQALLGFAAGDRVELLRPGSELGGEVLSVD